MPFYHTQLGRFGEYGLTLITKPVAISTDPDLMAAHLYAIDGSISNPRPNLQVVLASKGLWDPSDLAWKSWQTVFASLQNTHNTNGGGPLTARCPDRWPGPDPWPAFPIDSCAHELPAPFFHWNLRGFTQHHLRQQPDNVVYATDGTAQVDSSSKPVLLYIVVRSGDILISTEDYEWIKHPCIAGGLEVLSAGEIGVENHQICLVNLRSGHFIRPNVPGGSALAQNLISFTRDVFRQYNQTLNLACLHQQFDCVW